MSVIEKNLLTQENTTRALGTSWNEECSALVADALRRGDGLRPSVRLRVQGESMLPTLWPGDVVEIASCSAKDVRPGDIVLALRGSRLFLHRLVAPVAAEGFQLRGDSMPGPDLLFPPEALLGRLVSPVTPLQGRNLAMLRSRAFGLLLCHLGAARRLALNIHRRKALARESRIHDRDVELSAS